MIKLKGRVSEQEATISKASRSGVEAPLPGLDLRELALPWSQSSMIVLRRGGKSLPIAVRGFVS